MTDSETNAARSSEVETVVERPKAFAMEKPMTVANIVNARRLIDGPTDKLRAVSAVKYPWCRPLWNKMIGNKWEADQVVLVRDRAEFHKLNPKQQQAFRRAVAFLSNLDSIQCENLMLNVTPFITDPSVQQLLARQQLEEWIHVETYSTIVESIFDDPLEIYDMYRHNPLLSSKNDFITAQGGKVTEEATPQNKVKAIVSNIALEGIYFFSGFDTFFAINRATGLMNGSVDGIKYIQRDELTHLEIFINVFNTLRVEQPRIFTKKLLAECQDILRQAAEREIVWGKYVIDGGIPELTNEIVEGRIQQLAEERAQAIGIGGIFPGSKNPIPWVDDYKKITKGNFFESKPTSYTEKKPSFSRRSSAK
jgi:ribonucleoside-diphosphate reductase beta chain